MGQFEDVRVLEIVGVFAYLVVIALGLVAAIAVVSRRVAEREDDEPNE